MCIFISHPPIHNRILKLTVEQKCDIATRELDELREELQRKKAEMERGYDNHKVCPPPPHTHYLCNLCPPPSPTHTLAPSEQFTCIMWIIATSLCMFYCFHVMQAVIAEADLRMAEMKKAAYEFDRDIIRGAVNPVIQNIIIASIWLHHSMAVITAYWQDLG